MSKRYMSKKKFNRLIEKYTKIFHKKLKKKGVKSSRIN